MLSWLILCVYLLIDAWSVLSLIRGLTVKWWIHVLTPLRRLTHWTMEWAILVKLALIRWTKLGVEDVEIVWHLCVLVSLIRIVFWDYVSRVIHLRIVLANWVRYFRHHRLIIIFIFIVRRLVICHTAWRDWRVRGSKLSTNGVEYSFRCLVSTAQYFTWSLVIVRLILIIGLIVAALRTSTPCWFPTSLVWDYTSSDCLLIW